MEAYRVGTIAHLQLSPSSLVEVVVVFVFAVRAICAEKPHTMISFQRRTPN